MTTSEILGAIAVCLTVLGGLWAVVRGLLSRDRKSIDDRQELLEAKFKESRKVMWQKIDEHRASIERLNVDNAELRGKVNNVPSAEYVSRSIGEMEARIEKRLDDISGHMRDLTSAVINGARQ